MYEAIYDFALSRGIGSAGNTEKRDIAAYIELDRDGNYRSIEVRSKDDRKQKVVCPKTPKHLAMSPICEKLKYIWPACEGNSPGKNDAAKHAEWFACMQNGSTVSKSLATAGIFLQRIENDPEYARELWDLLEKSKIKPGEFISFRIDGRNLEKETDWKEWFAGYCEEIIGNGSDKAANQKKIVSCITGQLVDPVVGKFPKIMTPQTGSGVPVFSNDQSAVAGERCSFHSFGDSGSTACPMSKEETDVIKAGIEYLLISKENHDNNFGILYWFDNPDAINLIQKAIAIQDDDLDELLDELQEQTERSEQKEEAYTSALNVLTTKDAKLKSMRIGGNYHIMGFDVPAKGRLYLSDYHMDTYDNLVKSIKKWYSDTELFNDAAGKNRPIRNLYAVLLGLLERKNVQDQLKQAKKELGMDIRNLLQAALSNKEIPLRILYKSSAHIEKEILDGKKVPSIFYLQLIKAYLIRKGDAEMEKATKLCKSYDGEYSVGYHYGRWLAYMDYIQYIASQRNANTSKQSSGGVNVSLAKKYYKAMKKSPAKIFSIISDNKEYYLSKLKSRKKYDDAFGEIAEAIRGRIPAHFSIEEQAAFDLGYAQQRMEIFKGSQNSMENKEEQENE